MMENAGAAVAREALSYQKIAIFAGMGNNGGDGLVAARHLASKGKEVIVYLLPGKPTEACKHNLKILENMDSVILHRIKDSKDIENFELKKKLREVECIIDAMIGVGIKGRLREPVYSIVKMLNELELPIIAVDTPTSDTETKLKATLTISFHTPKTPDAKVVEIGIPPEAENYCGPGDVWLAIPPRSGKEHKGNFGRLLIIGGSIEYFGAPVLAAKAALSVGCDLVTIAAPSNVIPALPHEPDLIFLSLPSENYVSLEDIPTILKQKFDVILVGNGMGVQETSKKFLHELLNEVEVPIVVDADALKFIRSKDLSEKILLTPHHGEWKILFEKEYEGKSDALTGYWGGKEEETIKEQVKRYVSKIKSTVLLKGGIDIIARNKEMRFNRTGNAAMTVGGTGDVLAGVVSGLLAQNGDIWRSACAGAFLNGLAGDLAYAEVGVSLKASDLIAYLPLAIKKSLEYR